MDSNLPINLKANRAKQAIDLDRLNDKSSNEENIEYSQLPIDYLNNTLQYHLKAENGKVSYRIVNIQSCDQKEAYVINSSCNLPAPFIVPDQSTNFEAMNSVSSKRKVVPGVQTENSKVRDQKRSKHNEIERKRRDKINNWIQKLSKIVPECKEDPNKQPQSKGAILSKACDYIAHLKEEHASIEDENESLREELNDCKKELEQLRGALKKAGIDVDASD